MVFCEEFLLTIKIMAEISGLSNSEVVELCKPADPETKVCISLIYFIFHTCTYIYLIINNVITNQVNNAY